MNLIKIALFLIIVMSSFVLHAMGAQSRSLQQPPHYEFPFEQKTTQPSEIELVFLNLVRERRETGQLNPQLSATFNQLRTEGQRFSKQLVDSPSRRATRQQLGITDAQWQALMPQ